MDKISMTLAALVSVALVIMIAPGILRINQGKILRNIALWLAIFLGLALVYQTLGPGRLAQPDSAGVLPASEGDSSDNTGVEQDPTSAMDHRPSEDQGFTPPRD